VTGNDFSTLYAPLIRDGRMEKFYWEPDRDDRIGIVSGIFEQDSIARDHIAQLIDQFPNQSIDFYSALRSRLYDEQVRNFIQQVGLEKVSARVVNSADRLPEFRKPDFSLPHLIEVGKLMVREQDRIREMRLVQEYNESLHRGNRRLGEVNFTASQADSDREEPKSQPSNRQPASSQSASSNGHAYSDAASQKTSQRNSNQRESEHHNGGRSHLSDDVMQEVRGVIRQGNRLGIEFVDERRFRTGSWQNYAVVQGDEREAIAALESCLAEHDRDYIRIVGIEPNARRRILEAIVQRPAARY
jgi:ribulose bisphosphate carboxylase small subunit